MALLPNFPISGDDYTVGKITTVAGSKDFTTKDAYLQSYGAVQAGDHIYIASAGKFLIIASVTGENSGTLTDPCPEDCAVTDADLRVIFKTASSRLQGRTAMLLERLSKGCLASLAELTPTEGQFIRATGVSGQLETVNMSAAFVEETDDRKFMPPIIPAGKIEETDDRRFMTAAERKKISDIDNRLDGLTTDNVPETDTHKYFPPDFNADSLAETPNHKVMTADERDKLAGINGLEQSVWNAGKGTTEALVSPAKLFAAIAAMGAWRGGQKFGTDTAGGYILPNGLICQFGLVVRPESDYRMAFPMVFPNACMFATGVNSYDYGNAGGTMAIVVTVSNLTRDGVDFRARAITAGGTVNGCPNVPVYWFAIGY